MNSSVLTEIEERINHLSFNEQMWLIERIAHGLRKTTWAGRVAWESELAAMAADPAIQRELQTINEEFAITESDGLENL
jgi:hypothetical protein